MPLKHHPKHDSLDIVESATEYKHTLLAMLHEITAFKWPSEYNTTDHILHYYYFQAVHHNISSMSQTNKIASHCADF